MISIFELHNFDRRSFRNGVLILILASAVFAAGCGGGHVIYADNEADANRAFDILHSNDFQAEIVQPAGDVKEWEIWVKEGWFDNSESDYARKVLQDYGLPRKQEPEQDSGNSFTGITSDAQERKEEKRETEKGIEQHLYTLPDVVGVDALITQPKEGTFDQEKPRATASVTLVVLKKNPGFAKDDVRKAVSKTVKNLSAEDVNVIITYRPLREIPREQFFARRKSETIFSVGIGVILLLGAILGAVWIFNKRRKSALSSEVDGESEDAENALLEDEISE